MLIDPLPFPRDLPPTYQAFDHEPCFDPGRHLALAPPGQTWRLADFGYRDEVIRECASDVAVAGPFRLLSEDGVAATRSVALALRKQAQTSDRTAHYLAGGVYRSKFLRDLCGCTQIRDFLSEIAGCDLSSHSMPSQQMYINYAPDDVTQAVDTWHADSIGFDAVILLSDPSSFEGGRFQFFRGTTEDAARLLETDVRNLTGAISRDLPPDRVVTPHYPAAGYAVFQQGTKVIHRATRLAHRAERITLVPGYVARTLERPDPTLDSVAGWGEPGLAAEFARHKAWLTRAKLEALIARISLGAGAQELKEALERAVADVHCAIDVLTTLAAAERGD